MIGKQISQYRIIEKLGEGGMGIVYKAHDSKLDRPVALKFLPQHITVSKEDRERFLQEARAASAVMHPNVCVIYDLAEYEDQQFIVMEYVDGQTLRQLVPIEKLQEAIGYAIQIGEALQEAHSKGVVHRDIKTDNIMVNSRNQIKVMDFGLAKLKGSLKLTKTSSTVGTLAYMAPEQLQGGEVDARSDIFSFGVVLFEMLSGRLPFRGEHEAAIIYSILNEDPEPVQKYRPEVSSELLHIINRALEKDPEERYQSVHDLLIDLQRVKKETSRVSRSKVPPLVTEEGRVFSEEPKVPTDGGRTRHIKSWLLMGSVIALVSIIIVIIILLLPSRAPRLNPNMSFRTLEIPFPEIGFPSLSRDGNWIAFSACDTNREWSIYFMNVAKGNPQRLITESFRDFGYTEISPDGSEVLFDGLSDKRLYGVYVVSSLGGVSHKIVEPGFCSRWRPDGQRIGYILEGNSPQAPSKSGKLEFWTVKPDGRENRLEFEDSLSYIWGCYCFDWSPDGNSIAWLRTFPDYSNDIFIHELKTGKERQLTNYRKPIDEIAWAENDKIFFTSSKSGNTNVWTIPADGGEAVQITKGSGPDLGVRVSAEGKRLLYLEQQEICHIWTANIDGSNARQMTFDNKRISMPAFSPDEKKISFLMETGDPLQPFLHVYMMQSDGTNRTQLILGDAYDYTASWSPDGKYMIYGSFPRDEQVDSSRIYLIEVSNPANPRVIGKGWWAFWVDAEKFVVIPWQPSTFSTLYSIHESAPIEVSIDSTWQFPLPDGKYVMVRDMRKGNEGWWLETLQKKQGIARKQVLSSEYLWSSWPSVSFRYLLYRQSNKEVWRVSIPDGKQQKLPEILNGINPYFGQIQLSFNDQKLLFLKRRLDAKLVLIQNVFK
jgi:Tol biopolymer transport system component/predicted Ser/Thr protein kinase